MTTATRKKILTTHNAFWFTAVLITCLLVFIPDNGNFLILIPVMIASCGFVSLLSINKTLSNDGSPDNGSAEE